MSDYSYEQGDAYYTTIIYGSDLTVSGSRTYYRSNGSEYVKVQEDIYIPQDISLTLRFAQVSVQNGAYFSAYPLLANPDGTNIPYGGNDFFECLRYLVANGECTLEQAIAVVEQSNLVAEISPAEFSAQQDSYPASLPVTYFFGFVDGALYLQNTFPGVDDRALMSTTANGDDMPWSIPADSTPAETATEDWQDDSDVEFVSIISGQAVKTEKLDQAVNDAADSLAEGGATVNTLTGTSSSDRLTATSNIDHINGQDGLDTVVINAVHNKYTVVHDEYSDHVTEISSGNADVLRNVERVEFTDGTLRLDVDVFETAGEAYRLYQAAFGRVPDEPGLKYWINVMDHGQSHLEVAHNFVVSAEFESLYGTNTTDAALVTAFYTNVLGRAPDTDGFNYWMNAVQNNGMSIESLLICFSESAENVALVAPIIDDGIFFAA